MSAPVATPEVGERTCHGRIARSWRNSRPRACSSTSTGSNAIASACWRARGRSGCRCGPHLKTAKSAEVARRATGGSRRITVSTLKEADYFAGLGYADIVCATAIVPGKFAHAARVAQACDLILVTDAIEVVQAAACFAEAHDCSFSFLVEIDCGEHRSGLPATDAARRRACAHDPCIAAASSFAAS